MAETWPDPIKSSKHVSQAIDWVRHRTRDRVRLIIAIGVNGLAVAKPAEVDAEDAIAFLQDLQEPIARAIRQLDQNHETHTAMTLEDR
jgi:predicted metal-dependent hydrolase